MVTGWLAPLTVPAAGFFRLALAVRARAYAAHPAWRARLPAPSFGVGNVSLGGTGKTTMVSHLTARLEERGLRVGILSRGYARPAPSAGPVVVSRGAGLEVSWEEAGDEPTLLARRHPGAVVVVDGDRRRAAELAVRDSGAEALVLDDAFQHWRVRCDLDIVMIDAARPPWTDHLLPWGRLREPARAAARAHLVVLVSTDASGEPAGGKAPVWWGRDGAFPPVLKAVYDARGLRRGTEPLVAAGALGGRRAYLFSGLGNPAAFEATARSLGLEIAGHWRFRDHHRFRPRDLAEIARRARHAGAELVVTTAKDEVRLPPAGGEGERWILEVGLCFPQGEDVLAGLVEQVLHRRQEGWVGHL